MSYKYYSQTTSGWKISTDPKADPDKRWRAVHPMHGERFFDAHHKILEYTVKRMVKEAKVLLKKGDFMPVALCGRCGGRWWVDTNGNNIMDATDHYFLCPLLGPGRTSP